MRFLLMNGGHHNIDTPIYSENTGAKVQIYQTATIVNQHKRSNSDRLYIFIQQTASYTRLGASKDRPGSKSTYVADFYKKTSSSTDEVKESKTKLQKQG